jgi:hypothetical protein
VAADGLRNHFLAESQFRRLRRSLAEIIDDVPQELSGIVRAEELRQRVDLERARAKWFQADPRLGQCVEMALQPVGILGADLQRDGQ